MSQRTIRLGFSIEGGFEVLLAYHPSFQAVFGPADVNQPNVRLLLQRMQRHVGNGGCEPLHPQRSAHHEQIAGLQGLREHGLESEQMRGRRADASTAVRGTGANCELRFVG